MLFSRTLRDREEDSTQRTCCKWLPNRAQMHTEGFQLPGSSSQLRSKQTQAFTRKTFELNQEKVLLQPGILKLQDCPTAEHCSQMHFVTSCQTLSGMPHFHHLLAEKHAQTDSKVRSQQRNRAGKHPVGTSMLIGSTELAALAPSGLQCTFDTLMSSELLKKAPWPLQRRGHQHRAHGNGAASAGHDGCLKLFRSLSLDKDTLFCINLSNSVAFTEIHYCQATSPPLLSEDAFRAFNRWFKAYQRKDRFPKNITFSILKEQSPNPLCQCNVHQPSTLLKVNTRNFK
ncbi:hypothetical protein Anapl_08714 [Anas platyrhynchos]|uniref:Uncharacterized protein n=1 Tax=Anas platyrhynchos TaxID=8839 RepID=R0JM94_ANAPL|nr:hypothetical protein Anapl_08714 [Anas platyrhynchos]